MGFILIDRFVELERNRSAVASKTYGEEERITFSSADGIIVAESLLLESMAQTGGWLLAYSHDFQIFAPLLMIEWAEFFGKVFASEEVRIEARVESLQNSSGRVRGKICKSGQLMAEALLVFGLMSEEPGSGPASVPSVRWSDLDPSWRPRIWKHLSP